MTQRFDFVDAKRSIKRARYLLDSASWHIERYLSEENPYTENSEEGPPTSVDEHLATYIRGCFSGVSNRLNGWIEYNEIVDDEEVDYDGD